MSQLHSLHVLNRPDLYMPLSHVYSTSDFHNMIDDKNAIGLIAEVSEKQIGCCIVSLREPSKASEAVPRKIAYMESLFVETDYWKKGIGKLLYDKAEQLARENGAIALELTVWDFNKNAISFYKKSGMNAQRIIMEKKL